MSSEATMEEHEALWRDLERIGKSRVREEVEAAIRQEKERREELVTSHLQEVAELVRQHEKNLKRSEVCEKELRVKIRMAVEILKNASDPPVDGDEVCSEASTSYASVGQFEDEESGDVDSELISNRIEIAEGEGNIAQQEEDIHPLAFNLFTTTMRQPYRIQMNADIDKSWTDLSFEQKTKWYEIATAAKKTLTLKDDSFMAPGLEASKVPTPRNVEKSPEWSEDKARRMESGEGPGGRDWNVPRRGLFPDSSRR